MTDAPRRGLRRRLLAIALGMTVALGGAEVLLRLTGIGWYDARVDAYAFMKLDQDPRRLHWGFDPEIIPGQQWDGDPYGTLPDGAVMEYAEINRVGLRGPLPSKEDRPRILFMGDSFTFGEGVAFEQTFVSLASRRMAENLATPNFALNGGVPGYSTFEESLRLPQLLEWFAPEAVVVVFVPNDAIHVSEAFARDDDLLKGGGRGGWTPRIYDVLRLALTSEARTRETEAWYLAHYFGAQRKDWDDARAALVAMRDLCASRGTAFGVVYFPILHRDGASPLDRIATEVGRACGEAEIAFLDLSLAFVDRPKRGLWVHPVDHHPNARAHRLAAERVAPFAAALLRESTRR